MIRWKTKVCSNIFFVTRSKRKRITVLPFLWDPRPLRDLVLLVTLLFAKTRMHHTGHSKLLKMATIGGLYTTSYQSAIVTMALYCTIFAMFDVEEYRDLEALVTLILWIYAAFVYRWNLQTRDYFIAPDSMGPSSFTSTQPAPEKAMQSKTMRYGRSGHSRSSKLVPIESPYTTSYLSSIITICPSSSVCCFRDITRVYFSTRSTRKNENGRKFTRKNNGDG